VGPHGLTALVRGVGDIGSAVAHHLFRNGYSVVIHDELEADDPAWQMAFADAAFDGHAILEGVRAVRANGVERAKAWLASRDVIPVYVRPLGPLLTTLQPSVLVAVQSLAETKAQ
jgi:xanthine dehydrogenase accessory factor